MPPCLPCRAGGIARDQASALDPHVPCTSHNVTGHGRLRVRGSMAVSYRPAISRGAAMDYCAADAEGLGRLSQLPCALQLDM
jgi:hypothetical protein